MLHFDRVVKMTSSTYALYKGEKRVAELYITALGAMLVLEDKTVVEYDGENTYINGRPAPEMREEVKRLVEEVVNWPETN